MGGTASGGSTNQSNSGFGTPKSSSSSYMPSYLIGNVNTPGMTSYIQSMSHTITTINFSESSKVSPVGGVVSPVVVFLVEAKTHSN